MNFTSLFCGAGGLDIGFEAAGFRHARSIDFDGWSCRTIRSNRPEWEVDLADIRDVQPGYKLAADIILAGVPCQGFSLGGKRRCDDQRNYLYKEVVRLAAAMCPKAVVLENVLNLGNMVEPVGGMAFDKVISDAFMDIGYPNISCFIDISRFGVPQTRRRFVMLAFRDRCPGGFDWPAPGAAEPAGPHLAGIPDDAANHDPSWGFSSRVHVERGGTVLEDDPMVLCRLSRTASTGNPLRPSDKPFPTVDTGTLWGWAQGSVSAEKADGLWRVSADRIRQFTCREYARLQTFPDDWRFVGPRQVVRRQIGNAVPPVFAKVVAEMLRRLL